MKLLQEIIEQAWEDRSLLKEDKNHVNAIREVVNLLDLGSLRVAEPNASDWQVNEWVKEGCGLVFPYSKNGNLRSGYI